MKPPNGQSEPFDPMGPVGRSDEASPAPLEDRADNPGDARLIDLIDRATRPPESLKLDWGRLRANLAKEPMPRLAARQTQAKSVRPIIRWVGLAAAAVLALTTTLTLLNTNLFQWGHNPVATNPPKETPTPRPGTGQSTTTPPSPTPVAPTIAVGLTPEAAKALIDRPPAGGQGGMVVVFVRRPQAPAVAVAPPPAPETTCRPSGLDDFRSLGSSLSSHGAHSPLVLTGKSLLAEQASLADNSSPGQFNDPENDTLFQNF